MHQICGEDKTIEEFQPFVFHLYTEWMTDDAAEVEDTDALEKATAAGLALIHGSLDQLEMITYRKLPGLPADRNRVIDWLSGKLPVRRTVSYDGALQRQRGVLDILVRKVGNVYVRIINGPLHGQKLPLTNPTSGDYYWLEDKPFDYTDYDHEDEGNLITFPRLPGLNPKYVDKPFRQRYWIEDAYAYYLGDAIDNH